MDPPQRYRFERRTPWQTTYTLGAYLSFLMREGSQRKISQESAEYDWLLHELERVIDVYNHLPKRGKEEIRDSFYMDVYTISGGVRMNNDLLRMAVQRELSSTSSLNLQEMIARLPPLP